jgi:hypothetical protein
MKHDALVRASKPWEYKKTPCGVTTNQRPRVPWLHSHSHVFFEADMLT